MHYQDIWSWPEIPVEEIDRDEIEILYSFGHYDGPGTGLIKWKQEYYYVDRLKINDDRFWVIRLSEEQQEYALKYGEAWAEYFHTGMKWTPSGHRVEFKLGKYGFQNESKNYTGIHPAASQMFRSEYPSRPAPAKDAEVVGFFVGWQIE